VLRRIRFAEATCSRILEGFCKSHRDFMAMCCVEAAVQYGNWQRVADGKDYFSPFVSCRGRLPLVSNCCRLSLNIAGHCGTSSRRCGFSRGHLTCSSIDLVSSCLFTAASCAGGLILWAPSYSLSRSPFCGFESLLGVPASS
jgi:hypothetical protein